MAGRPPLDVERVIPAAMNLCRRTGYKNASILQLEAATGTIPFSIDRDVCDKSGLLVAAPSHYLAYAEQVFSAELGEGGVDGVLRLLDWFVDDSAGVPEDQLGCLAVNLGVEAHSLPERVRGLLANYRVMMRRLIRGALTTEKSKGEVAAHFSIDEHADFLAVFIDGCAHTTRTLGRKSAKSQAVVVMKRTSKAGMQRDKGLGEVPPHPALRFRPRSSNSVPVSA